ncbi:MAG: DUF21 domain-containing protein [Clostridia bacterium]|nr:DUF21 domain-containing protein [Clostridia bacterium]
MTDEQDNHLNNTLSDGENFADSSFDNKNNLTAESEASFAMQKEDLKEEKESGFANNKAESLSIDKAKTAQTKQKSACHKHDDEDDKKKKQPKKKHNTWWIKVTVISFVLAAFFSFLSELTADAEHIVVILLLLGFLILASILFDAIGVAVTSCDDAPIIAMASRKIYGAKTAMWLVKNSSTVASICNDVIGDIFGIISGACSAAIVVKISFDLDLTWQRWLAIGTAALISALTIGGKAFMKNIAIKNSKEFVLFVARFLAFFIPEERRRYKKESEKKKQQEKEKDAKNKPVEKSRETKSKKSK